MPVPIAGLLCVYILAAVGVSGLVASVLVLLGYGEPVVLDEDEDDDLVGAD